MKKEILIFNEFKQQIRNEFFKFYKKSKCFTKVCNRTLINEIQKRCEQLECSYEAVSELMIQFQQKLKIELNGNYHNKKRILSTKGRINERNAKKQKFSEQQLEKRTNKLY